MAEDAEDSALQPRVNGTVTHETCGICATVLDPKRWMQFEPPCGHKYHYVCVRHLLATDEENSSATALECEVCRELVFSETDGLALLHRECSREIRRPTPTDVEFWVSTELQLGRAVQLQKEVPRVVLCLKGLRCLDFTGHPITRLPVELLQLRALKRLVLVSLHITELPEEIGQLELLEQLFATGSRLRHLPGSMGQLQRLWEFYFDGNQLRSLPDPLPPRMDGLKVSGNELVTLPELDKCPNVRNIRAYGNRLTHVPSTICSCSRLCDVLLQGNDLRSLPEELGQTHTIRTLLLHDNYLESLPDSIGNLQDLRWLYLYNNQLRELPRGLLSRATALERLLIEANPLSGPTMLDLLQLVPRNLRLMGVDALQVASYRAEVARTQETDDGSLAEPLGDLPPCVTSGWMLPWGRLYGKLSPASQLRRGRGVQALSDPGPVYGGDVLVVAFAASQGEPEWFGVLGQLLDNSPHPRISRDRVQTFEELYSAHFDTPPGEVRDDAARRAAAAMWMYSKCPEATAEAVSRACAPGHHVTEFDVLSLCETNAQWYVDTEWRPLGVTARLAEISQHYRRVMFIGTSMGGFGALSNAHLAHTVAVFGPQTNLSISHLRQGFGPEELEASTTRMRASLQQALQRGTRIQYHVAMEDHLVYARHLPLPPDSLVIHPIFGRIARLLERAGVLAPLLAELIAELQSDCGAQPRRVEASLVFAEEPRKTHAWDWMSDVHEVVLGKWDHSAESALSFVRASGRQLRLLCQEAPKYGEWFCTHCWARAEEQVTRCPSCGSGCGGAPVVGAPGSMRAWHRNNGGKRRCHRCGQEAAPNASCCPACSTPLLQHCVNCRSEQATGYHDQVVDVWYCTRCWGKFEAMNEQLRKEIPRQWYVEGGQRWAWADESRPGGNGYIDFCRNGHLNTSWGRGVWEQKGTDMDVAFGSPPLRRRLRRTAGGFRCVPAPGGTGYSSSACTGGWPLYGSPYAVGWFRRFSRLLQQWSMMLLRLKLKPAQRNRHWLLPLVTALLFAVSAALSWRPPRRALQTIAGNHVL